VVVMRTIKSSLIVIFLLSFILLSTGSQAVEMREPTVSECYNPWHYNAGDHLGTCSLLFDENDTTGYVWRESNTWLMLEYASYMLAADLHTVTANVVGVSSVPTECLLHEGLQINVSDLHSITCWNGAEWVYFGELGGFQPNAFYEVFLDQTPGGTVSAYELVQPEHEAIDLSVAPRLVVDVSDLEGREMSVNFYVSVEDPLQDELICGPISSFDGQVSCQWRGLDYDTEYEWYITLDNGEVLFPSDVWTFTTGGNSAPYISSISPADGAIDAPLNVDLSFVVNDADTDTISVNIQGNLAGDAVVLFETNITDLLDGDAALATWTGLGYSLSYEWNIVVSDGTHDVLYGPLTFTTQAKPAPQPPSSGPSSSPNRGGGPPEDDENETVVVVTPPLIVEPAPSTPIVPEPTVNETDTETDVDEGPGFISSITGAFAGVGDLSYLKYAKYVVEGIAIVFLLHVITWRRGRFVRKLLRLFLR